MVNFDEYFVFKFILKEGFKLILEKCLGSKVIKMVYDVGGFKLIKNVEVVELEWEKYCINDEEIF